MATAEQEKTAKDSKTRKPRTKGNFNSAAEFVELFEKADSYEQAERLTGLSKASIIAKIAGINKRVGKKLPFKQFERATVHRKAETLDKVIEALARARGVSKDEIMSKAEPMKTRDKESPANKSKSNKQSV